MLGTSLIEVLLVASLVISKYLRNADLSYPTEVVLPILLFAFLLTPLFYAYKALLKSSLAAHVAALPMAYGLYGYTYAYPWLRGFVASLIPQRIETALSVALVSILLWGALFGIASLLFVRYVLPRIPAIRPTALLQVMAFTVCFIFASQLFKVGQCLWAIRHQLAYASHSQIIPKNMGSAPASSKPNIYYLVFDRYASSETLDKDYGYDNSAMTQFLGDQGFVTRDAAYANYPFTMQSVSSTLAMDYHTTLGSLFKDDTKGFQTAFPYRSILDNPPVATALKEYGYSFNQLSSWWDLTHNSPSATAKPTNSFRLRVLGTTHWLTELQRDIAAKSILSPLLLKGISVAGAPVVLYDKNDSPRKGFEQQIGALEDIARNSSTQKAPQFTFAHILSPHDPYVFTDTGASPEYDMWRSDDGIDETAKYVNQLKYINTRIEDAITTLRQKDPDAIIMVQSDEGPYPKEFRNQVTPKDYYNPLNLPAPQLQQKFGILASYYFPGVAPSEVTEKLTSSVNAFRFIFNTYLGFTMTYLPDCHFSAGNRYSLYDYHPVGELLTGKQVPEACAEYQ